MVVSSLFLRWRLPRSFRAVPPPTPPAGDAGVLLGIDFGGLTAVDNFNLMIGRNEIAGLIGPNGAGKTTVFNLLTNVYQPSRGSILLDGVPTAGKKTYQVNRMGVARTFQNIRLFKDLSVIDNVKVGLHQSMNYRLPEALLGEDVVQRLQRLPRIGVVLDAADE